MAIESGAARGLRALGLFIDFQKEAQIARLQLGRALTETVEKQLRYNAVIREGAKIQGAHAAASQTVKGQLGALRREFNNLREDIGAQFQDNFKALVGNLRGLVGWLRENTDLLKKFGEAALWVSGVLATYALADKIMALAKSIAALQLASLNPYVLLAVGVVGLRHLLAVEGHPGSASGPLRRDAAEGAARSASERQDQRGRPSQAGHDRRPNPRTDHRQPSVARRAAVDLRRPEDHRQNRQ